MQRFRHRRIVALILLIPTLLTFLPSVVWAAQSCEKTQGDFSWIIIQNASGTYCYVQDWWLDRDLGVMVYMGSRYGLCDNPCNREGLH